MKLLIIVVCCLCWSTPHAQYGYVILQKQPFNLSPTITPSKKSIEVNKVFIDKLHYYDQLYRQIPIDQKKLAIIDSLLFIEYRIFYERYGFIPLNKNLVKGMISDYETFLLKSYIFQLHFSDRFAFPYMEVLENSILRKSSNEFDLMDYFVTYLWRKTEFRNFNYFGHTYHVLLLPDLTNSPYVKYYKFALDKYLNYSRIVDDTFVYAILNDINILNNIIDWSQLSVVNTFPILRKKVTEYVNESRKLFNFIFHYANALGIKNGRYSVLITSHPNMLFNPFHLY